MTGQKSVVELELIFYKEGPNLVTVRPEGLNQRPKMPRAGGGGFEVEVAIPLYQKGLETVLLSLRKVLVLKDPR